MNAKKRTQRLGNVFPWVIGILAAQSTGAYVVTFSNSQPQTPLDWSTSLPLPQFNVPGSVLTGIELDLSSTLQMDIGIENTGAIASVVSYSRALATTFGYPVALTTVLNPTINITTVSLDVYDGFADGMGASGVSYDNATASANTTVAVPAPNWGSYQGGGNFNVTIGSLLGTAAVSDTGKSTWHDYNEAVASAVVTVRYTYSLLSEIPEGQAVWAGVGLAALGLGMRWRASRAKAPTAGKC